MKIYFDDVMKVVFHIGMAAALWIFVIALGFVVYTEIAKADKTPAPQVKIEEK